MSSPTNSDVLAAFFNNRPRRTEKSEMNGYPRRSVTIEDGKVVLWSYRTEIAYKIDGRIYVNLKKYSVTTSKFQRELVNALADAGYVATGETKALNATVPGRWYGAGPAWHRTGYEDLPFTEYRRQVDLAAEWDALDQKMIDLDVDIFAGDETEPRISEWFETLSARDSLGALIGR